MTKQAQIIYRIDSDDKIVDTNDFWDQFAVNNQVAGLSRCDVLGKHIWDFIENAEAKHFHTLLLEKLRRTRKPLEIPFRCDSPDTRRFLTMRMELLKDGGVEYTCTILKEEKREPVALLIDGGKHSGKFVRMCSWCKKVYVPEGRWLEVEEAIGHLGIFDQKILPQVTHTICEECSKWAA